MASFESPKPAMLGPPMKNCTFVPASIVFEKDDHLKVIVAGSLVALYTPGVSQSRKRKSSTHATIPRFAPVDGYTKSTLPPGGGRLLGYGILYDDVVRPAPDAECEAYTSVVVHGVCNYRTDRDDPQYHPGHELHPCLTVVQSKARGDLFVRVMVNSARVLFD